MTYLLNVLIAPAYADVPAATPAAGGGSMFSLVMMFGIFFLFFYFVLWRPQNKRTKQHRDLLNALAKGDEVITSGGVLGKINKMTDKYVVLIIHNNTEMVVQKSAIVSALPKGTLKSLE